LEDPFITLTEDIRLEFEHKLKIFGILKTNFEGFGILVESRTYFNNIKIVDFFSGDCGNIK
jgi:hypothetical protein